MLLVVANQADPSESLIQVGVAKIGFMRQQWNDASERAPQGKSRELSIIGSAIEDSLVNFHAMKQFDFGGHGIGYVPRMVLVAIQDRLWESLQTLGVLGSPV